MSLVVVAVAVPDKVPVVPLVSVRPPVGEAEAFPSLMRPALVVAVAVAEPPVSRSVQIPTLSGCWLAMGVSSAEAAHVQMAAPVANPSAAAAAMALGVRPAAGLWSS